MAFAGMIATLFAGPLGTDAVWRTGGAGDGVDVRVVLTSDDEIVGLGGTPVRSPRMVFEVRAAEVAAPAAGDTVTIDGTTWLVRAAPRQPDPLRLLWRCEAVPA